MSLYTGRVFAELAPNVRHAFVSAQTQGPDPLKISVNEWNEAHNVPDCEFGAFPGISLNPVDSGTTAIFGGPTGLENCWIKRLAYGYQFRIQVCVIDAEATASLVLQYTTDLTGASGWTTMGVSASLATVGNIYTSWTTVPVGAQGSGGVLMRWVVTK